jgi:hypothetical protein
MRFRTLLTWGFVLAGLLSVESVADAAHLTLADFQLKRASASVGATASIVLRGTMDRSLPRAIRKSPGATVTQTCRSDADPSLTQVASQTALFPFISFSSSTGFADRGNGKKVQWTVTLTYDPASDPNIGRPNPPGANTLCPFGFSPATPLAVTSLLVRVWPGTIGSPPLTDKGELLWVVLVFGPGNTVVSSPRDGED